MKILIRKPTDMTIYFRIVSSAEIEVQSCGLLSIWTGITWKWSSFYKSYSSHQFLCDHVFLQG